MRRFPIPLIGLALVLFMAINSCKKSVSDGPALMSAAKSNKTQSALDAPTLACGEGSTGASINITVTAGASGAPAGFSVQWMKKSDYDTYGWNSDAPSYCHASFSGVPGCSNYNLSGGQFVEINIGDLSDECGVSGGCGDLDCGTEYVFRAFAHNVPQGSNKSDFSETITCSTEDCANEGCTLTQGFWKTHGPEGCVSGNNTNAWPEDVMTNGLNIGGTVYSASQLCTILNTAAEGTNYALAHQLIAALLNQVKGASVPGDVQACIDAAQTYFTTHTMGAAIDGTENTQCLTDYNEGLTGPGHCSN